MPPRRRSSGFRSKAPRTRWLAIVPNSRTISNNNEGAADEIIIRDLEGTLQFNDLVGGTLLKVLLTMETNPIITPSAALTRGYSTDHHGLFMTEDNQPNMAAGGAWDPNIPYGSFMIRWSSAYRILIGTTLAMLTEDYAQNDGRQASAGPQILVATDVMRRITENDRLWVSHWHFEDATVVTSTEYGWSGRILVRLP